MARKFILDEEYIVLIQSGNQEAMEALCQRYQKYAYGVASDFFVSNNKGGITLDDFSTVALEAILVAVKKYTLGISKFYPYWKQIAIHQMIKYNEQFSYFHHGKTFYGISLDAAYDESSTTNDQIFGLPDHEMKSFSYRDMLNEILNNPKNHFSSLEKKILLLLVDQHSIDDISEKTHIPANRIYYHCKKAKEKLGRILEKQYQM